MINSSRSNGDFGIEGYVIRQFNPYMDKPRTFRYRKEGVKRDFHSLTQKKARETPSPGYYNVERLEKRSFSLSKLPRRFVSEEIAKREKNTPSPFHYRPSQQQKVRCIPNYKQ